MRFNIKDDSGKVIDTLIASQDFIETNYSGKYELVPEQSDLGAREWRNGELSNTDWIVPVTDHPEHNIYKRYRKLLRDWTSVKNWKGDNKYPMDRPDIDYAKTYQEKVEGYMASEGLSEADAEVKTKAELDALEKTENYNWRVSVHIGEGLSQSEAEAKAKAEQEA